MSRVVELPDGRKTVLSSCEQQTTRRIEDNVRRLTAADAQYRCHRGDVRLSKVAHANRLGAFKGDQPPPARAEENLADWAEIAPDLSPNVEVRPGDILEDRNPVCEHCEPAPVGAKMGRVERNLDGPGEAIVRDVEQHQRVRGAEEQPLPIRAELRVGARGAG